VPVANPLAAQVQKRSGDVVKPCWQVPGLAAILSKELEPSVKFFCCYDEQGTLIARCQTMADVDVLKKMGRPVVRVAEMTDEESVVCSLTDTPAEFNQDY